ncbi:hypothetical protein B1748_27820 [Paenibacillus sp. MY03]|nr:hypothetical protein B1748_27820 [Paenibacillus sp. MY03]
MHSMKELNVEVLVVGGGTAGVSAALAAAEAGVTVCLAEFGSGVGGVGTHTGVHVYYLGTHTDMQRKLDREVQEIAGNLGGKVKGFHPEAKKIRLEERLAQNGVTILYDHVAVQVILEGKRVTGVVFESPYEVLRVEAKVVLDCTGNGDICALAGAPFASGREWDGVMHAYSLPPRYLKEEAEIADFLNFDVGWVDSSSARDVSRALLEARKVLWDLPELGDDRLIAVGSQLGVREGRRIVGQYVLTLEDLALDRRFEDVVMRCYTHYDNHALDLANESRFAQIWEGVIGAWKDRIGCDVPYRSFVPVETDGLLIACRALSMDHDTATSFRMQPDMHCVGEVAGTAAALCVQSGRLPRDLEVPALQRRLINRGVLKKDDLVRQSAPWLTLDDDKRAQRNWTLETVRRPEVQRRLIEALGTEQEGPAIWWLWKSGENVIPLLKETLAKSEGKQQRGAAMALALLGDRAGSSCLVRAVEEEAMDAPPGFERFIPPRWIACLILLKELREASCLEVMLDRLQRRNPTARLAAFSQILHVLHYLIAVSEQIPTDTLAKVKQAVNQLLAEPELGEDWQVNMELDTSIRWNIEMTAAYLLALLGEDNGYVILDGYMTDERAYARNMAHRLKARLRQRVVPQDERTEVQH